MYLIFIKQNPMRLVVKWDQKKKKKKAQEPKYLSFLEYARL